MEGKSMNAAALRRVPERVDPTEVEESLAISAIMIIPLGFFAFMGSNYLTHFEFDPAAIWVPATVILFFTTILMTRVRPLHALAAGVVGSTGGILLGSALPPL